ncbi:hypothetical protein KIN20_014615 [Parelaphostrongylus tenuis]|uniref:Uncharacterized protein n=1 Tax=Parelaphostrongylus tenuis TaxID=148309 RepID=A0AAD5QPF4_PARTN|nr:hypothetical protein KIN20_014615 [Parelaphostrongylus tenuis]
MDEDKFPFEDHDLGSLNGAVRQGEDENGYDDDYSEDSRELNFPTQKAVSEVSGIIQVCLYLPGRTTIRKCVMTT